MQEAFRAGEDLHTKTARAVLGREPTKHDRQLAKALNFGLLYGMGAERLRTYAQDDYERASERRRGGAVSAALLPDLSRARELGIARSAEARSRPTPCLAGHGIESARSRKNSTRRCRAPAPTSSSVHLPAVGGPGSRSRLRRRSRRP